MGAGDSEDDDPDPSNSRTDNFRVCVLANANPNQDTSASTTYLGNQVGNTNMVEDILVGRSGAGGEKKNLYMKNDDVDKERHNKIPTQVGAALSCAKLRLGLGNINLVLWF